MRKFLTLSITLFFVNLFSQEYKEFYVVQKNGQSIEPSTKSRKANNELTLTFSKQELQNYFNTKKVFIYEKAFPESLNPTLKNTYYLRTNNVVSKTDLANFSNVEFVEEINLNEGGLLFEPNDYYFEIGTVKNQNILDLIRAPLAWEVTQGDPNIIIGIVDTGVNTQHPELVTEVIQHFGSTTINSSHGTKVASFASGATNNNTGFSSIGFNTKMITSNETVPYSDENNSTHNRTRAMYKLSLIPGVKVLNGSWYRGCSPSTIDSLVYDDIKSRGVFTVFAAGNGTQCGGPNNYLYPQAYPSVFTVTSVGHLNDYEGQPIGPDSYEISDVHLRYKFDPGIVTSHHHYDKIDLSAIGYSVIVADEQNSYKVSWGTSFSSPMVAGAASLLYSVNPNLTPQQVGDILKETSDNIYHIPENQEFIGLLGAGRLNAFRAVKTVQCMDETNPTVDFMIKDSREDVGHEPNNNTQYMWTSNDIYVRNQNDGQLVHVHQNPTYDGVNPNYIYVRVTNLGCQTSSGNDLVKVNWAKANTSLAYPDYWDGSIVQNGVVFGGLVGTGTIPPLAPGQEALVEIPWNVPDPEDYQNINANPWHFCLLAEINSDDDPLTSPYTTNPNHMVRNNNNLAWRNITVIDISNKKDIGAAFAVSNPYNSTKTYFLELVKEDTETGKAIYEEAEVAVNMDNVIYAAWERGGKTASQLESTKDEKKKIVKGNNVIIDNLQLNANELGTIYLSFNFLTKKATDKNKYRYHVIQKDASTGEIMGGETFEIKKKTRNSFSANAGNTKEIEKNEEVTLTAQDIFEAAQYNWYDENGNLIYTGQNLTVSPEITKKYKLEVISEDGFKDYSEVEVKVNPYKLISLSPNPANSQIQIDYDIENSTSAYLMITGVTNGVSNNYVLNTNSTQTIISLANYQYGNYIVTLVCDGQIVDSKNLIKN